MKEIRVKMVDKLNAFENYFVVDSVSLEICKISRFARSKICKDTDYAMPYKFFYASQNLRFYGYKLHAIYSIAEIFQLPTSVHDIHYLEDIKLQLSDYVLIGDTRIFDSTNHPT